jgi:diamine N-acetyltransferase
MTDLAITRATEADIPDLGIIGPAAYAAAYHEDWDDAVGFFWQIQSFGSEAMANTLTRPDARVWIARQEGVGVGFLTMFLGSLEPINGRKDGAEIPRIYLLPGARRRPYAYVWLDVMEHAEWARAAYERWGFTDIGGKVFSGGLRPGRNRGMRVLAKELK